MTRPILRLVSLLVAASLVLVGCSTGGDGSEQTADDPSSATGSAETPAVCVGLARQLEPLNFFPSTLGAEGSQGGRSMLQQVRQLEDDAPAGLRPDVVELRKIMAAGVKDPSSFRRRAFIDAKIALEDWYRGNC